MPVGDIIGFITGPKTAFANRTNNRVSVQLRNLIGLGAPKVIDDAALRRRCDLADAFRNNVDAFARSIKALPGAVTAASDPVTVLHLDIGDLSTVDLKPIVIQHQTVIAGWNFAVREFAGKPHSIKRTSAGGTIGHRAQNEQ